MGKNERLTTIQVTRATAKELQSLGRWGDTYDAIIRRLLNGQKPAGEGEPDEDRGDKTDESTGNGH